MENTPLETTNTQQIVTVQNQQQILNNKRKLNLHYNFNDGDAVFCAKTGSGYEPGIIMSIDKSAQWWRYHIKIFSQVPRCGDFEFQNLLPLSKAHSILSELEIYSTQFFLLKSRIRFCQELLIAPQENKEYFSVCHCKKPRINERIENLKSQVKKRLRKTKELCYKEVEQNLPSYWNLLDAQIYKLPSQKLHQPLSIEILKSQVTEIQNEVQIVAQQLNDIVLESQEQQKKEVVSIANEQTSNTHPESKEIYTIESVEKFIEEAREYASDCRKSDKGLLQLKQGKNYIDYVIDFHMGVFLNPILFGHQIVQDIRVQAWTRYTFENQFLLNFTTQYYEKKRCPKQKSVHNFGSDRVQWYLENRLDQSKHLVMVVNVCNNHWICVLITANTLLTKGYKPKQQIYLFDSLFEDQRDSLTIFTAGFLDESRSIMKAFRHISNYLWNNTDTPELICQYKNLPQQDNFVDCGFYALEFASDIYFDCQTFLETVQPNSIKGDKDYFDYLHKACYANDFKRYKPKVVNNNPNQNADFKLLKELKWPVYDTNVSPDGSNDYVEGYKPEYISKERNDLCQLIIEDEKEEYITRYFVKLQQYVIERWSMQYRVKVKKESQSGPGAKIAK